MIQMPMPVPTRQGISAYTGEMEALITIVMELQIKSTPKTLSELLQQPPVLPHPHQAQLTLRMILPVVSRVLSDCALDGLQQHAVEPQQQMPLPNLQVKVALATLQVMVGHSQMEEAFSNNVNRGRYYY